MSIIIDRDIEQEIKQRACQHGYVKPIDYLRDLLKKDALSRQPSDSRGRQFVDQLRGKATRKLTTDQIMRMTRE